ncbi:MAG: type II and III secretion system protein family protein [Alphaproteobacteria bacterium]|jgi:pilus assembly protein CpaC|nr:type II and III secretion system protein family protein [Alphaproteobacteria bacterium]
MGWTAKLVAAGLTAAVAGSTAPAAFGQSEIPVTITPLSIPNDTPVPPTYEVAEGKARLIELPEPVRDVIIADPEIADVIVKTPRQVYLVARAFGSTNVFFVGADGEVILHAVIEVRIDLAAARKAIRALLPDARIELKAVGPNIVLTGTVRTAVEATDAAAIASQFVAAGGDGGGEEGEEEEGGGAGGVINMIRILEDQQVLIQVRVAEMQRNVTKNLAARTNFLRLIEGRAFSLATAGGELFDTVAGLGVITFDKLGLQDTTLLSLERQGLVKTLAEPVLTAISGETANFLAGGELPTPAGIDSNGNLIIEFREFGVVLSFTPVVLAKNQISLRISTEVSRQAEENKLVLPFATIAGTATVDVIGLSVRRAESTVTLPSGGSLMIAGLLQNDEFNTIDGTPWFKDIPILGALFRSTAFLRNESEVVVLVKAFVVRPVEAGRRLALPTDGFVPASDFDIHMLGRLYKQYSDRKGIEDVPIIQGPIGYIME